MKGPETDCFGEQPPNHAIEGSDFILVITSKNYPEDSTGVLTAYALAVQGLKRNDASASRFWDSVQTACCQQHQPAGTQNLPPFGFSG